MLNQIINLPDTRYPAEYPVDSDIRYSHRIKQDTVSQYSLPFIAAWTWQEAVGPRELHEVIGRLEDAQPFRVEVQSLRLVGIFWRDIKNLQRNSGQVNYDNNNLDW